MPRDALLPRDRKQPVGRHGLGLALELERLDDLDLDGVAHEPVGRLTDEHLHRGRVLLEPRRDVHGVARDQPLAVGDVAGDHLAGVDAGPVLEADTVRRLETFVHPSQGLPHLRGGANRPDRVVLVQDRQAEDRHDRVADVLLHGAAVALEHRLHLREVQVQHLSERFAVQPLAEARRALQVAEDDRDGLADLLEGSLQGRAAPRTSRRVGSGRGSLPRSSGRSARPESRVRPGPRHGRARPRAGSPDDRSRSCLGRRGP